MTTTHRARMRTGWPLLHAVVLGVTFCVFAWTLAFPSGLVAGTAGVVLGTFAAQALLRARFRIPAVLSGAVVLAMFGLLVSHSMTDSATVVKSLGLGGALEAADAPRWLFLAFAGALAIRTLAIRYRPALAVEGAMVVMAIATTVAAHRDGMIARPLQISDWFWRHGVDPVVAFLSVGIGGAILLANVLAHQRSMLRTISQLALVLILGAVLARVLHGQDASSLVAGGGGQKENTEPPTGKSRGDKSSGQPNDNPSLMDDLPKAGHGRNRPVAVVVFHRTVEPTNGIFYFRHAAFSQYNGVRLVQATRADADPDVRQAFPTSEIALKQVPVNAFGRTAVATDVALLSDHESVFGLVDTTRIMPIPNPDPARFRRAYRTISDVVTTPLEDLLEFPSGDPAWTPELRRHYTELPSDKRYTELAATIRKGLRRSYQSNPLALALSVKKHLEQTTIYSLDRTYEGAEDPAAAYLFSADRRGYCVHIAHAATFLLRALGVPARVGAGYAVPVQNLAGGSALLVKAGNAHAWTEIYLKGVGWLPIEITPERTDVKPMPFVEQDLQNLLGEMARKPVLPPPDDGSEPINLAQLFARIVGAVPWVFFALLAIAYACKLWRVVAPAFAREGARARLAYRAALDRLSSVGITRDHGESRERFARRVAALAPSFPSLTDTHLAIAFGSSLVRDDTAPALLQSVRREVRASVPLWRRCAGALHPFNWLLSK